MAIIQDMPNEILHSILSYLHTVDLLSISMVSHSFHTTSLSLLYKEPYLGLNDEAKSSKATALDINSELHPQESVALFLRTLLRVPGGETFADHVRTLIVDLNDLVPRPTVRSTGIDLLTAAASNRGFDNHHLTEQGAQIVLILRLLPRLSSLELRAGNLRGAADYKHLKNALMFPTTLPIGLQNIHIIKSIGASTLTGITPMMLVALLDLPFIRTITVPITHDPQDSEQFMDAAASAAGTSTVTELNLHYGEIPITSLAVILKIPRSLTYFSYASDGPFWDDNSFGKSLVPLQQALHGLDIDFTNMACFSWDRYPIDGYPPTGYPTIGTLRGWEKLDTLKLPLVILLGEMWNPASGVCLVDLLPLGLRSLVVYDDWSWSGVELADQLVKVFEGGQMVALRELTVVGTWEIVTAEVKERLERVCRVAGVVFVVNEDRL